MHVKTRTYTAHKGLRDQNLTELTADMTGLDGIGVNKIRQSK